MRGIRGAFLCLMLEEGGGAAELSRWEGENMRGILLWHHNIFLSHKFNVHGRRAVRKDF